MTLQSEIHVHRHGAVGHISLNRPKAINALTQDMCEAMADTLLEWRNDDAITAIILDHAEGRGFCAGGDVQLVRRSALEDDGAAGRAFFRAEYRLNHMMFTYSKPIIAFMDGVTMGGGVGISQPCKFRVATENTMFAMPEGSIGLFPDVGAGWYLPRLPGQLGRFLGLTGARLDGAECLWAGLATHYVSAADVAEAKAHIIETPHDIDAALRSLMPSPAPDARLAGNAASIDKLFAPDTLEGILAALEADGSDWANKELKAVASKCPTTCKVALRQLAADAPDFAANMALEYRIAARMLMRHDFIEGVRAVLVDKDGAPQWHPSTPEAVTEAMLDAIFAPLPDGEEWTPLA
ncbi:enoyl-CoA hydratase [Aurantiacibacter atlanticus]|uniref:3-hydroxyisobutyryl-CoA hydrolase n=1 Tax=Aurantiacibacter atlanticus TaxID=1648404 RepID=A0A0H4W012_9SPHN|nr:enoyl-CoA hydratase/isomerase family protein [Aurantiacibacter atlanticus]AKQ42788.1 enoyl-CoA hydratase [Aurantiacibacter atlanticus]MDF1835014.1 enoyl-CoA hydratase/isomerase family protein [Alteraurantiacibacter sp. bin_em_oilr2.035]